MTRAEFLRGYLLLTTQPWGKAYRTLQLQTDGEPSPAEIQVEFYYQTLQDYDAEGWKMSCETFAKGDHWPSLDALTLALKHYVPVREALPAPDVEYVSMQDALADNPEALAVVQRILATP